MSDPLTTATHRTLQEAIDQSSLWLLFALIGGAGASVLALGMLLRSNQLITARAVIGTTLHSVVWGAAVFMLVYEHNGLGLPFVLGVSVLSGMGAASFVDLLLLIVKQRLGISVTINPPAPGPRPAPEPTDWKDQ